MSADTERTARLKRLHDTPLERVGASSRFFVGSWESYVEIWKHRELLWLLVKREVRAKYKGSALGVVWSFARPLSQLVVYFFIVGQVLGVARAIPDFAIYVFVGLTVWGLFAEIVNSSSSAIIGNSGIIKKVYLPREIFPLSAIASSFFTFLTQFVVLLVAIAISGHPPLWQYIPSAVLALVMMLVFSTALAFFFSAVNVYVRDVQYIVDVIISLLFWATPVVYSLDFFSSKVPAWLVEIYLANPVTLTVISFQRAFWSAGADAVHTWPSTLDLRVTIALLISLVLLFLSQRVFARLQKSFAQEL